MGQSSFARTSFLGGEWSKTAQGRFDLQPYVTSLNVCLNALPTEEGAWSRRSGTIYCGHTRRGTPGRVIDFEVNETNPIGLEFTDGYLRFRNGQALVVTSDEQAIVAISAANPAVVQTTTAYGWATGSTVIFKNLGQANPLLQNRQFTITVVDSTHFSLHDALTGANIDGSTLVTFLVFGTVSRVLEMTTIYKTGSWASLRSVQAEDQTVLLNSAPPQVLEMTSVPGDPFPTFTLAAANFLDGPYLDPFNGSICTYSAVSGNVTLTFSFQPYSATISYNVGDYVTSGGVGYQSLTAANENNTPAGSPSNWKAVNGGAPVGPNGFTAADIGRHIRLFSEPQTWASGSTYSSGNVVKYNDGYWQAVAGSTGVIPGTDVTKWVPVAGVNYAVWTWGRVLSVSGSGLIAPSVAIGNMTGGSGLAGAFDGNVSKNFASSAQVSGTINAYANFQPNVGYNAGGIVYGLNGFNYQCLHTFLAVTSPPGANGFYLAVTKVQVPAGHYFQISGASGAPIVTDLGVQGPTNTNIWVNIGAAQSLAIDAYIGQDFSGAPKAIEQATIFPSNDLGFANNFFTPPLVVNLWASNSLPANPEDGTLLGSVALPGDTFSPVTVPSANSVTTWKYVWFEVFCQQTAPPPYLGGPPVFTLGVSCAQAEFFSPNVNNGSVITVQIAGPALLYAPGTVVNTWRAGLFTGNGNVWPTVGCYTGGRLWLGGAAFNRVDASQTNDLFNFAPTEPDGTVVDNDGISATFNADSVNSIFWMMPDLQGIIAGTDGGEWLIVAPTAGPITPTNIDARRVTKAKMAQIEPVRAENTIIAVQRRMRKIIEYFADAFSGKLTAPNLIDKARHLTVNFIQEVRYQQEITPTIWFRDGSGNLFGGTYRRDVLMTSSGPTYIGWHRHVLGSGRIVQSITVGASQGGTLDALSMVTNDPTTNIHHVEMLADIFEEGDSALDAWFLDDAVVPSSYVVGSSSVVFSGLWHLNGKTVTVFAGGLDCGDFAVSNGSVTVPYGDGVSEGAGGGLFTEALVSSFSGAMPAVIGFNYTSDGQLTRAQTPQESGARTGPALAKKRRMQQYGMLITTAVGGVIPETTTVTTATGATPATPAGLQVGTNFNNLRPADFRQDDDKTPLAYGTLFSGVHWDSLDDTASFDGMLCWRVARPWPCLIAAIEPFGETQDR